MSDIKEKASRSVQWFVECDAFTNESLERELSARGLGSDHVSKHVDMPGSDGKPHDVLAIPSSLVRRLKAAKANDGRFHFRFWKRNGPNGVISPADFVEKKPLSQTAEVRRVIARLSAIKKAKTTRKK